jgi:hypothetical protein
MGLGVRVFKSASGAGGSMRFDPIAYQKQTRRLHRAGALTHAQFAVADVLTWSCRPKGKAAFQVSYDRIAELAHVAHSTAVEAVARLKALGLLTWEKTRLRIVWSLGVASRQWRNVYTLRAPVTESAQRPTVTQPERNQDAFEKRRPWRGAFCPPIRTVEEQLAILRGG